MVIVDGDSYELYTVEVKSGKIESANTDYGKDMDFLRVYIEYNIYTF